MDSPTTKVKTMTGFSYCCGTAPILIAKPTTALTAPMAPTMVVGTLFLFHHSFTAEWSRRDASSVNAIVKCARHANADRPAPPRRRSPTGRRRALPERRQSRQRDSRPHRRAERLGGGRARREARLRQRLRPRQARAEDAGDAADALQHRLDQQAIHRRGDSDARGGREALARRQGRALAA